MGRRQPVETSGQRTPTFLNSDAYFRARGSGLDWLGKYGPSRGINTTSGSTGATYGGRSVGSAPQTLTNADGTRVRSGNQVIDFTTGQNLDATNPYTALTGDYVTQNVSPTSPQGRYNQMTAEQNALAAAGLEEGRTLARQVRQFQDAQPATAVTSEPFGTGRLASGPYGLGASTVGQGLRKSFGSLGSSSPEQMRQDELGEQAIARRNRAGVSTQSLIESGRRRFK